MLAWFTITQINSDLVFSAVFIKIKYRCNGGEFSTLSIYNRRYLVIKKLSIHSNSITHEALSAIQLSKLKLHNYFLFGARLLHGKAAKS
ncbi:hypothetical protein D186_21746 [Citrobacter freundii ATCC 8090 = MTCC 1658 = NBRC 12681]|nr:hypothetical protein D186_21746 [Citrobacter freundii ATCC 8090 = MTCC 1658 = NBRC 12681]EXF29325.1 hypothetical protein V172_17410 [Citrobacter freundii RLS1]VDZ61470.1 Uncharacterised protein [Citrobacter freundii]